MLFMPVNLYDAGEGQKKPLFRNLILKKVIDVRKLLFKPCLPQELKGGRA
jgi:hypothetical protein